MKLKRELFPFEKNSKKQFHVVIIMLILINHKLNWQENIEQLIR